VAVDQRRRQQPVLQQALLAVDVEQDLFSSVARCTIAASIALHSSCGRIIGTRSSSQGRSAPCGSA
jgi:hypothetical protein